MGVIQTGHDAVRGALIRMDSDAALSHLAPAVYLAGAVIHSPTASHSGRSVRGMYFWLLS